MDIIVLDTSFNEKRIIDSYKSLIWTDRYQEAGDFELVLGVEALSYIQKGYYLYSSESEHLMVVESFQIETSSEDGNYLIVTGRSIESVLDRRIVWTQTNLDGYLQGQVQRLLNENVISPSNTDRRISNVIFQSSTDSAITSTQITAQYTGDNLYDVIVSICKETGFGWKMVLNSSNQFVFSLYNGKDRSYNQTTNPYVIFSSEFDNIINSNYLESDKSLKNVTLVAGEGEGTDRKTVSVGTATGLSRRELFTDARDISSNIESGTMPLSEYNELLTQRGNEALAQYISIQSFEGEVDYQKMFRYGTDYFIGDICEMENEYGISCKIRVLEIVISVDSGGTTIYPTFCSVGSE